MVLNRYPLPLMNVLGERVGGWTIFTKLDVKYEYNLIHIIEGDKWKTAFCICDGHFKYLFKQFRLANAPAMFQNMMNEIFQDMINLAVIIYLYNILIHFEKQADYIALVQHVLLRLQEHKLAIAFKKCECHKSKVNSLEYIISADYIEMDQDKIKTMLEWDALETAKDIQSCWGL